MASLTPPQDMFGGLIFLGDAVAARATSRLAALGIALILDLSGGPEYELPPGCSRQTFAIEDVCSNAGLMRTVLEECLACMDQAVVAKQPCLVHCAMGASRSATCVIAWLMTRQKWTLYRALNHCKRRRAQVRPNNGFFALLQQLDCELHEGRSSMPLDTQAYAAWCLMHPRGEGKENSSFGSANRCALS
eukprot:m.43091 g.43091  ORF g.43091 m.43091 type:complete len:190 (+) comp14403_c0_seq1:294-863(+)